MRREPTLRNENQVALALAEIERIKALLNKITDGRRLVIDTGSGTGDTTPPVETAQHVLYGSKHTNSLRITNGGGLLAAFESGQVWINGVFFGIAAGTTALADASTNYVFVNNAGAVADNTTGFPIDGIPLAIVITAGGAITTINDRRAYLNAGAWSSMSGILTTRGDLLTRDATQLIRLGIGAAGSILRADGTDPAWTINPTIAGYVRIGSVVAPTNITAGDLTIARLFVGDAAAIAGIEALITGDLQATTSIRIGREGVEAGTLIVHSDVASGYGYFRFVNPNVIEAMAFGDSITMRAMTNTSVTPGAVPGAVELQAGAGLNSQGGSINITAGAGVAGVSLDHNGGMINILTGNAVGAGTGGIINLESGRSPGSGSHGAVSVRIRSGGIADMGPGGEFRIQQDQDGAGGAWGNVLTVITTGMMSGLGGHSLGNMLDLQNETDDAPEFGAIGGQYDDWTLVAYSQPADDSRNLDYLISPRDKAFYLWNTHVHGTTEEFFRLYWSGNTAFMVTNASGAGVLRDLTLNAGNGGASGDLHLFGNNVILRSRDVANGILLDLPEAAGASFVKVRDSAFAEVAEIDSDGNAEFLGYLRAGSVATPVNVTPGDITATRLQIGSNLAFSAANGYFTRLSGTLVDTASGAKAAISNVVTVAPAAASASEFRLLYFQALVSSGTGIALTGQVRGGYFEARIRSDGGVGQSAGLVATPVVIDSGSPAAVGQVDEGIGVLVQPFVRPSGTSTVTIDASTAFDARFSTITNTPNVTINTLTGLKINAPPANPVITDLIGIDIAALSQGSGLNIGIRNLSQLRQVGQAIFGIDAAPGSSMVAHFYQPTLGDEIIRIQSAATADDPAEQVFQNRVATTDATVTTLHTFTIPASTTVFLEAHVVARRTGGAAGVAEDGAAYIRRAAIKNVAGVATIIGAVQDGFTAEDQGAWDCTIDVTGATARVRVTGALDNNVTWHLSGLWARQVGT